MIGNTRRTLTGLAVALALGAIAQAQPAPVVHPQQRVDRDDTDARANETSTVSPDANPLVVLTGWNDYRDNIKSFFALSEDGGQNWSEFPIRPPTPNQSSVEGDPMTAVDHRDGTLWAGAISFNFNGGIYVARKDPGADEFNPSVMAHETPSADKGWMAAGPDPADPDNPDLTKLYMAYNLGLLVSDDRGDTWTGPDSLGNGLGYLPRIGPDGELYILFWDTEDEIRMFRSDDGGETIDGSFLVAVRMDVWGVDGTRFPGTFRVPPLAYLAVDPGDGTLHCVYFDTTFINEEGSSIVDIYHTRSTNGGTSWTVPSNVTGAVPGENDNFFPWIEVDSTGRLHILFLRAYGEDNEPEALVEAAYAYSDDDGDTWTEEVLSPEPWNSEDDNKEPGSVFLGDYLGMGVAANRAYPVYVSTQNGSADIYANTVITPAGTCDADLTGDGAITSTDLNIVLGDFGCDEPPCEGDVNGDGATDSEDLNIVLGDFGGQCP